MKTSTMSSINSENLVGSWFLAFQQMVEAAMVEKRLLFLKDKNEIVHILLSNLTVTWVSARIEIAF